MDTRGREAIQRRVVLAVLVPVAAAGLLAGVLSSAVTLQTAGEGDAAWADAALTLEEDSIRAVFLGESEKRIDGLVGTILEAEAEKRRKAAEACEVAILDLTWSLRELGEPRSPAYYSGVHIPEDETVKDWVWRLDKLKRVHDVLQRSL
ncbi:MAG: hypothetical protein ACYTDY_16360 [Planctomycetota bacterium]|jgi:hypothetical protein